MTPELIISTCSIIVATSAVGMSIWQTMMTRQHNKLSVCPHLSIDYDRRTTADIAFILNSSGLGPSKLISYKWIVNNKEFSVRSRQDYQDLFNVLGVSNHHVEFYGPTIGRFVEQGFSSFLVKWPNSANNEVHNIIKQCLESHTVKIVIEYESIYGEKFQAVQNIAEVA